MKLLYVLALVVAFGNSAAAFDHQHKELTELLKTHVAWNTAGTSTAVDYAGLQRDRVRLQRCMPMRLA